MKMYRETLFWSIFTCLLIGTEGSFEFLFNKCCKLGLTWAQQGNDCEKYLLPLNGISLDQQIPCLVTVEICCSRYARSHICEAGKDMAFSGSECKRTVFPGIDFRKDCCDGCKLGLITGSHGFSCSMKDFSFDYPWDEAFADCCELAQHSIVTSLITLPDANSNTNDVQGNRCDTSNPCQHHCKDTGYAIECSCRPGYDLALDKKSCIDIDECSLNQHSCDSSELCSNTEGSFLCLGEGDQLSPGRTPQHFGSFQTSPTTFSPDIQAGNNPFSGTCATGYAFNPISRTCNDIDECAEGRDLCNRQREFCLNLIGGYQCQPKNKNNCPAGYKFNNYIQSCEDIDECAEQTDTCDRSIHTCINTVGSHRCILKRLTECSTGYRLDLITNKCIDMNECLEGLHDCDAKHYCVNTPGGYQCQPIEVPDLKCGNGFRLNVDKTRCEDINECQLGTHSCVPSQRCDNTIGSFTCIRTTGCGTGYTLNQGTGQCEDIDECIRGTHECRGGQKCINRAGGYACQCLPGYRMNENSECEDIDECTRYSRLCTENGECRNTPGSYVCECKSGFKQTDDGKTCIDMDECTQQYICHQKCINTWGSYKCACDQGYTLSSDGRTCQDIDECSLWKGRGNLCIGICVNEPGSYSCQCPAGYRLDSDKRTCQDIDECSQGNICKGDDEVCLNTRGSYRCNTIICPPNYNRDREHRNWMIQDQNIRCDKACHPRNTDCLLDPTKSIRYQFVSLASMPVLREPLVITNIQAVTIQNVWNFHMEFNLLPGRNNQKFDLIQNRNIGSLRLISPIQGPDYFSVEMEMKVIIQNNITALRHVIIVKIDVCPYEF